MNDRDIGPTADYGRPDEDGRQTLEAAIDEASATFWQFTATVDVRDMFEDDVVFEAGDDSETISVYRKHDRKLLAEEYVSPYGEKDAFEHEEAF